ncbi:MAG TPA: 50S ribosomal protein L10 [Acholeplasmataceae bacterium]|jgi:large subunit ribosomal protein L10|nr:50S ribosomal protein L10 [Acholeplasmataceae bacterium]
MRQSVIKKQQQVEELTAKFQEAKTIVTFDYPGLTVAEFTKLRHELRKEGCEVEVIKNNISRRASIAAGIGELADSLTGAKAIVIGYDDVVAPAKIVYDFAKTNKVVKIQAGVVEGKVVDAAGINALATLPSRETMLTMLAAGMLAPVRDIAIGLNMLVEEGLQN